MRSRAPGKLILSGEHAVVYGCPALVMAVNRFAQACAEPLGEPRLQLSFPAIGHQSDLPLADIASCRSRLESAHQRFLCGEIAVRDILASPLELLVYAFASLLDRRQVAPCGLHLELSADIPISCGMGSSAAVVLAALGAMAARLGIALDPDEAFRLAWETEKLQHGHTSGTDPWICCHGGSAVFQRGEARREVFPDPGWSMILTGTPDTTTGEAVAAVAAGFADSGIWGDFTDCTQGMLAALAGGSRTAIHAAIRTNHRLLCEIGVVPARVQRFVAELEELGCSAKVSGAGAVSGDHAGVLLALVDAPAETLCDKYGYQLQDVALQSQGLMA